MVGSLWLPSFLRSIFNCLEGCQDELMGRAGLNMIRTLAWRSNSVQITRCWLLLAEWNVFLAI